MFLFLLLNPHDLWRTPDNDVARPKGDGDAKTAREAMAELHRSSATLWFRMAVT